MLLTLVTNKPTTFVSMLGFSHRRFPFCVPCIGSDTGWMNTRLLQPWSSYCDTWPIFCGIVAQRQLFYQPFKYRESHHRRHWSICSIAYMSSPYHITSHLSIRLRIEARIKDSKPKDVIDLVNRYRKLKYQISDSLSNWPQSEMPFRTW